MRGGQPPPLDEILAIPWDARRDVKRIVRTRRKGGRKSAESEVISGATRRPRCRVHRLLFRRRHYSDGNKNVSRIFMTRLLTPAALRNVRTKIPAVLALDKLLCSSVNKQPRKLHNKSDCSWCNGCVGDAGASLFERARDLYSALRDCPGGDGTARLELWRIE